MLCVAVTAGDLIDIGLNFGIIGMGDMVAHRKILLNMYDISLYMIMPKMQRIFCWILAIFYL